MKAIKYLSVAFYVIFALFSMICQASDYHSLGGSYDILFAIFGLASLDTVYSLATKSKSKHPLPLGTSVLTLFVQVIALILCAVDVLFVDIFLTMTLVICAIFGVGLIVYWFIKRK